MKGLKLRVSPSLKADSDAPTLSGAHSPIRKSLKTGPVYI